MTDLWPRARTKEGAEKLNRELIRLSRTIIHPKFRGAGLAVHMVRETLPMVGKKVVEVIATMPRYNPYLEKAGMIKVGEMPLQPGQRKVLDTIRALGGDPSLLHSPVARANFIDGLSKRKRDRLTKVLLKSVKDLSGQGGQSPTTRGRGKAEADRMMRELADQGLQSLLGNLIPVKRVYLYWINPALSKKQHKTIINDSERGKPP